MCFPQNRLCAVSSQHTALTINTLLPHIYHHYHGVYYGAFDFTTSADVCTLCKFTACVSFNSHIMPKLFIPVTVDKKNLSVHSTAAVSHWVHFYRCDVLCDIMWNGYKYWTCGGKDSSYNLSRRDWSLNVYPRIYNSCFIFYLLSFCALESYHPPLVSQYLLLHCRTLSVCLYLPSAPATMVNEILSNANCLSVLKCLSVCLLLA